LKGKRRAEQDSLHCLTDSSIYRPKLFYFAEVDNN
jgi:hypothetical protein